MPILTFEDPLDVGVLDEEAFFAPDHLTEADCREQIGADWRWPEARLSMEDDQ